jgi:hypothetical protein
VEDDMGGMDFTEEERNFDKFKRYFKGANFMTPVWLRFGNITKDLVYELSRNRENSKFMGNDTFGVTVQKITGKDTSEDSGLSKCFFSRQEAEDYIKQLTEEHGQS